MQQWTYQLLTVCAPRGELEDWIWNLWRIQLLHLSEQQHNISWVSMNHINQLLLISHLLIVTHQEYTLNYWGHDCACHFCILLTWCTSCRSGKMPGRNTWRPVARWKGQTRKTARMRHCWPQTTEPSTNNVKDFTIKGPCPSAKAYDTCNMSPITTWLCCQTYLGLMVDCCNVVQAPKRLNTALSFIKHRQQISKATS